MNSGKSSSTSGSCPQDESKRPLVALRRLLPTTALLVEQSRIAILMAPAQSWNEQNKLQLQCVWEAELGTTLVLCDLAENLLKNSKVPPAGRLASSRSSMLSDVQLLRADIAEALKWAYSASITQILRSLFELNKMSGDLLGLISASESLQSLCTWLSEEGGFASGL